MESSCRKKEWNGDRKYHTDHVQCHSAINFNPYFHYSMASGRSQNSLSSAHVLEEDGAAAAVERSRGEMLIVYSFLNLLILVCVLSIPVLRVKMQHVHCLPFLRLDLWPMRQSLTPQAVLCNEEPGKDSYRDKINNNKWASTNFLFKQHWVKENVPSTVLLWQEKESVYFSFINTA